MRPRSAARPRLAALAVLATLVFPLQIRFDVDIFNDLRGRYPRAPFTLGDPWPTLARLQDEARAAGLQSGDRLVAVEGQAVNGMADLMGPVRRKHVGDTVSMTVARDGEQRPFPVRLDTHRSTTPVLVWVFGVIVWGMMPLLCLGLGFSVAALRPRDPRAWLLLALMLCCSQLAAAGNTDPHGWPAYLRIPAVLYQTPAQLAWSIGMMLFGLYSPERWSLDRRFPWAKWILLGPLAVDTALRTALALGVSENYRAVASLAPVRPGLRGVRDAVVLAAVSVFVIALYHRLRDPAAPPDSRRRLRLLFWGSTASLTPLFLLFLASVTGLRPLRDSWDLLLAVLALFLFPLTLTYVVLVQRALDVGVVVRQGMQYALARGGVRALHVALTAGILLAIGWMAADPSTRRAQKMQIICHGVMVIFLVRRFAERVRLWIDRKFFREAYNTEKILSELGEEVHAIVETGPLLKMVAHRVAELLHVERLAMLVGGEDMFRPAYALGYAEPPDALFPSGGGAVEELRRRKAPLPVQPGDESSWLHAAGVTPEERAQLARLEARLLLPLVGRRELLGFVSLGPKRSEAPYSSTDIRLLRSVAAQTGLALENSRLAAAVAAETAQREVLSRELDIAREVQQRLFPQITPPIPGLDYAGYCRPARGVGGDCFDFLALSEGRLGIAIGDVSGKGIPAALLMASLQASERGQALSGSEDLARLMENVNRLVYEASAANRYATFFYSQYDPSSRRLTYVNGGHNAPALIRGDEVKRLDTPGMVIGLFPVARYVQAGIDLCPGDVVVLFTDGVSEAMNPAEEEWGEDQLIDMTLVILKIA